MEESIVKDTKKLKEFYKGKKILITGHTGFKGSWLCVLLQELGAKVYGYALLPPTNPDLFTILGLKDRMDSFEGDIRNLDNLQKRFDAVQPEIVFHLAAQPIVRESYVHPVYTYETNVMGTVNLLECVRNSKSVRSIVNVTTDKVYKNKEWNWGYRENEELNGFDPYSNSKSCSELVTNSYCNSFLSDRKIAVSTARAGNVLGGGDFAVDRIIPDCYRATQKKESIIVRNPYSIRPYQHVLEPLYVYLLIAMYQYNDFAIAGSYNVGPDETDCLNTGELVTSFCNEWKIQSGEELCWQNKSDGGPHEAGFLRLDCSLIKKIFNWSPSFSLGEAMSLIVSWYLAYASHEDMYKVTKEQIQLFLNK